MEKLKPIPFTLSQWGSGTEILYKCPKCGQEFRILGNHEKYCHNCGQGIEWEGVPVRCSTAFKQLWDPVYYGSGEYDMMDYKVRKQILVELMHKIYIGEIQ